jgi:hypothetical protein
MSVAVRYTAPVYDEGFHDYNQMGGSMIRRSEGALPYLGSAMPVAQDVGTSLLQSSTSTDKCFVTDSLENEDIRPRFECRQNKLQVLIR